MSKRSGEKKKRLGKAARTNRRIPPFVVIRTGREVSQNPRRRNWRTEKLNIKEK